MSRQAVSLAVQRWRCAQQGSTDASSRFEASARHYSRLAKELRLVVSAITHEDQQLAVGLIDALKKQHDGPVTVNAVADALTGQGCSVLHPDVRSSFFEPGEYVMRLPPPLGQTRVHPDDEPIPNMREFALKQRDVIFGAATMQPPPHAIITIGSKFFNSQVIQGLRTAADRKRMRLPPLVQYHTPDLWDFKVRAKAAAVWRSKVDYALCLHPFEPALLQSEHCGAAFTGHHLVRPIIRAAREAGVWMHTYLQQQPDLLTVHTSGQEVEAFCRKHGLPYKPRSSSSGAVQVQQAGHTQRGADFLGAASLHASASASSSSSAGGEAAGGSAAGVVRDPVVCLLPGQHEMDLKQLVPLYDAALRQLDQKHSNLRAVLLSTPFWHNSLKEVAASFGVPTTVVDLHSEGQLALEACDVAISHAGPASLHCAVAGVPMVAVSPVNAVWDFWPMVKLSMGKSGMQHASLPNLLLGSGAVPEVMMMMPAAAASKLCGELDQLLRQADLRRRQQQALQQVVLAMVPPSTAGQLLMPEEVAASLVLDVIRQHAEDQRRAAAA